MKRIFVSLSLIFISQSVFADLMCDANTTKYFARYTVNQYTCSSGQFLPADTTGCVSCPTGYTCSGGTYTFNPNNFQGLDLYKIPSTTINNVCANNFPKTFVAKYTPNQYTCSAGYYLPAGDDWLTDNQGCTICPSGNKCIGGTYTFNETTAQGIESCPSSAPHAPAGSAVCYSRILHLSRENPNDIVYLKDTATTTPAFHVSFNGNTFYANLTTTPTYITNVSTRYLTVMVDGVEYYVCDDSTCPSAE